jgi:predicted enzyme related to lactoylglutathione lyase
MTARRRSVVVSETFVSVVVADMKRATAFYVDTFGATASFATPVWTSTHVAGVRIGLAHDPKRSHTDLTASDLVRTGIHFAVDSLESALAAVVENGGRVVVDPMEVAPGVVIADVADTEGNILTLRGR